MLVEHDTAVRTVHLVERGDGRGGNRLLADWGCGGWGSLRQWCFGIRSVDAEV